MDAGPYYDVWGVPLLAYAHAFRQYPTVLEKYFSKLGISGNLDPEVLKSQYVPMTAWVKSTHDIVDEVGASTVYSIGKKIPDTAPLPPGTDDIKAVLMGVDISFHMHHRKDGVVMFDPATGTMLEGIGHYHCELQGGGTSAHLTCDNPYPCDLDRGIIAGFAARFEPAVSVSHATSACRKKGDNACVYLVQW
jgi:hypothetical protein